MDAPEINIVEACIFRRTETGILFLLLKRKSKNYAGLWQGISGKVEKNEQAWKAALRELKEETGLNSRQIFTVDYVAAFYEEYLDSIVHIPFFGIEVDSAQVQLSEEHSDFCWVEIKEALKLLTWKGQKEAHQTVFEMLDLRDQRLRWSVIND